jgi:hypothetical protein
MRKAKKNRKSEKRFEERRRVRKVWDLMNYDQYLSIKVSHQRYCHRRVLNLNMLKELNT